MFDINTPSHTWENRMKSWFVKCLIKSNNIFSLDQIADCIGISTAYLNTKLARNSFSFEDILTLCGIVGKRLYVIDATVYLTEDFKKLKEKDSENIQEIDWINYLGVERVNAIQNRRAKIGMEALAKRKAHEEYLQKKAELEEIKKTYNFKD